MDNVDLGEPIPIVSRWWDENGVAANPTTITVTVTKPNGVAVTKTKADHAGSTSGPTPPGTLDVWKLELTADVVGLWRIHTVATVNGDTAIPQEFMVLVGLDEATGWCGQWASWEDVSRCSTPPDLDAFARDLALDNATEILYLLSDRKYPGICTTTRSLCFAGQSCWPEIAACSPYPAIDLGGAYPVWDAWDVKLSGVALDPAAYEVRGRRFLVRLDGQAWPYGTIALASNPDPLVVTWAYGRQPPVSGRLAAARYAAEIAKLCAGDPCGVNVQSARSVTREGTNYTVLDADSVISEGRTGLGSVDAWLVADAKRKPEARIFHPALGASRRLL